MKPPKRLEDEIQQLKHEMSVTIPQEMQSAIEMGDLRENTEFSSVLERQHFIGIRLDQLNKRVKEYENIHLSSIPKDRIGFGSLIKARHLESNKIVFFKMVLNDICDEEEFKYCEVTMNSPIGKSFLGRKIKDEILVQLPFGKATYRILHIITIHDQNNPTG